MSILEALFSGAKVFLREAASVVSEAVKVILEEVDRSAIGKATTGLIKGATKRYFTTANDLAEEERDLAEKRRRDGRLREEELERLREIERERQDLRKKMDAEKAREAAASLREAQDEVVAAAVTDDEASASVGILSTKVCPECGGAMRVRQGPTDAKTDRPKFFWQCTNSQSSHCPSIKLDPQADQTSVIRRPDADLDGPRRQRVEAWNRQDVLTKTHGRLRSNLGEDDTEIICPHHLIPMKLMPKQHAGGRLLDSYEYVCLGVRLDGHACDHKVTINAFPQVSAALRRREGRGIIDGM